MEYNKLYTIKWRDCFEGTGWYTQEMLKEKIKTYNNLELSGHFVYEDENWYIFAATPVIAEQNLSPIWIPKNVVIEIQERL